jgi:hypothetical protein
MALRRISAVLRDFANQQGWKPGEYQILYRVLEEWGRITIFFIVKDFGGLSQDEMRNRVWDHLETALKLDGGIGFSFGISVHTPEQVERGGPHSIPDSYFEEELLLGPAGTV